MNIKVKLLNSKRYKNYETMDAAIARWQEKGWRIADVAQDIKEYGDDAVAILWMPEYKLEGK